MQSNRSDDPAAGHTPPAPKKIGTVILVIGLAILLYGAVGFWLIQSLPPNGGPSGRLPSLYVMGAGVVVAMVGLVTRDFRTGRKP